MKTLTLCLALCLPVVAGIAATDAAVSTTTAKTAFPVRIVAGDGQLISHDFVAFVTAPITPEMKPTLDLAGSHLLPRDVQNATTEIEPRQIATHQYREILVGATKVPVDGTLLVFNLEDFRMPAFKSATRFRPMISWTEPPTSEGRPGNVRQITSETDVYLGNMRGAALWTIITIGVIVLLLLRWSFVKSREVGFKGPPALFLLTGPDGYLSLWRSQLILWTLAVGAVVFLFGLVRLRVPEIPESLVVLMGLSLGTGAAGAATAANAANREDPEAARRRTKGRAEWADLISSWNSVARCVELSVPKAQMVIWTAIVLVLFVVKSLLLGELWPVPWELVTLTGMSQLGYVGDKYIQSTPKTAATSPNGAAKPGNAMPNAV